jgi:soluble lytic murein transglycosylase-like protein
VFSAACGCWDSVECYSGMYKHLKTALMAATIATSFLLSPRVRASDAPITPTTDASGRKIYVNDAVAPTSRESASKTDSAVPVQKFRTQQNGLVYWSTIEHRWKAVPHANVQAAKSAAAEVSDYLGKMPSTQNSSFAKGFTQREIDAAIDQAASRHNVDANLVRALVKVESNFNPNAVSRKGAMGLMQLMPQTARQLNLKNPFDPQENIDAGVRHLKQLLQSYGGDVRLSLAAYNAGSGAVARSRGVPRYAETQNYVRRITSLYGGNVGNNYFFGASREPVKVQRDERGVLYISNTD